MNKLRQVYGLHAVESLLSSRPSTVTGLTVAEGAAEKRLSPLIEKAAAAGITIHRIPRKDLDQLIPGARHQGVIASVKAESLEMSEKLLPEFIAGLSGPAFLLILDGVQDPHNLGACLRTADAAGVHAVILPRDRAVGITPVVHKVASGAAESVPIFTVTNLARTMRQLRDAGIWIYGTSDAAEQDLYQSDLQGPIALVMGSEGKGLRRLTREHCDHLLAIPMAGQVESLNVSVAAGVLLFEARRQRLQSAG
ncbi:MAG: 23S rRNA (guanosine(2251)-2'-O)-methyltransferase RlmB [Gammaproteobacteria bacterium]|nr:23S rRNA (guanosine(2251)-2'-O)-methyltransferase RlmB [Gammaproteobacteria bacterium]